MIIHYKTAWSNFNVPDMQEESINKTMAIPNNYNHEGLKFEQVQNYVKNKTTYHDFLWA